LNRICYCCDQLQKKKSVARDLQMFAFKILGFFLLAFFLSAIAIKPQATSR
jgi:hypothetical protein